MFDHFGRRLQRDLKHIVDTRIQTSELLSGGLIKVGYFSFDLTSLAVIASICQIKTRTYVLTSFNVSCSQQESTLTSFRIRSNDMQFGTEDLY